MDVLVQIECGYDHDGHRVGHVGSGQQTGRLDPVHLGHSNVEQADIGLQSPGQLHRLATVGRFAHHVDVVVGVKNHAQAGTNKVLVIGQ